MKRVLTIFLVLGLGVILGRMFDGLPLKAEAGAGAGGATGVIAYKVAGGTVGDQVNHNGSLGHDFDVLVPNNLAILSAEAPITAPLMTDGSAFVQLEEEFRQAFEMTVIDLPRNMLINFPHLLTDVNVVVLATEMTLASARDAIRLLSWLKTNANHAQVMVVANKVQPGAAEISKADFEASIERKINFSVPFDFKAAANSAKLGQTFAEANRASKAGGTIRDIGKAVMGASDGLETSSLAPGKKSLLGKLDLKSMMPSKKVKVAVPAPFEAG